MKALQQNPLLLPIFLLSGCGVTLERPLEAPDVPPALQVPSDVQPVLALRATGLQVYACARGGVASAFRWAPLGPEATLADFQGGLAGRHFAGTIWAAVDGSAVHGDVVAKVASPTSGAVPWLLLRAKPAGSAHGLLSEISSIQQLHTVGGEAPDENCLPDAPRLAVPFQAVYYFYRSKKEGLLPAQPLLVP
ncbi:MAG: DUF3455 domain-containing protein [Piscinibacter sp.]|nr:DUF3455 domain-containing protein [Piscinibacter sp.]